MEIKKNQLMGQSELDKIAREIIKNNIYLSLATSDGITPWVAPLFYAVDVIYNFYFISQLDSLHSKHILKNPTVAFAIFDSHQPEGSGNGVQGSGKAYLLDESKLPEAMKWYKTTFIEMKPESFTGDAPYRFFKLVPKHFYILDPEAKVDKRVEVNILEK